MRRALLLLFSAFFLFAGCTGQPAASSSSEAAARPISGDRPSVESPEVQFQPPAGNVTMATLKTSKGDIQLVLYGDYAPLAVENFAALAREGYYDGTAFHRVVEGFVVQGGDATGTGQGGDSMWGHPFLSEFTDELHHYAGAVCMAGGDGERDSHLSQFYIVAAPAGGLDEAALEKLRAAGRREEVVAAYGQAGGLPYLDYTDTVFGHVYAGMEVVDAIAAGDLDEEGKPKSPVVIQSVEIEGPAFS